MIRLFLTTSKIVGFCVLVSALTGCATGMTITRKEKGWHDPLPDPIAMGRNPVARTYPYVRLMEEEGRYIKPVRRDDQGRIYVIPSKPLIDTQGKAKQISGWTDTGFITYIVPNPEGWDDVKRIKIDMTESAIVFGRVRHVDGRHYYQHRMKGKEIGFQGIALGSQGVLLALDHYTLMLFDADDDRMPKIIRVPESFELLNNGTQAMDISFTRHIMIKRFTGNARNSLALGLRTPDNPTFDVAFLNLDTGEITTIFARHVAYKIGDPSNQITLDEAIANPMGILPSKDGPIVTGIETPWAKKMYARNLHTGKKVLLWEREGGISGCTGCGWRMNPDGTIRIKMELGFTPVQIDDLISYMKSAPIAQ